MSCDCGEHDCLACHRARQSQQEALEPRRKRLPVRGKKQHQLVDVNDLPENNSDF